MQDDDKLKELENQKKRDNEVIKENEQSFKEGRSSRFTNEQTENALNQTAKNEINELYYGRVFPYTNAVVYFIYYIVSLVTLPFVYLGKVKILAVVFWVILVAALIISRIIEKRVRSNIEKENECIKRLLGFADQTSMFSYLLTSLGYMVAMLSNIGFWFIFAIMVVVFFIGFYYEILKPMFKKRY